MCEVDAVGGAAGDAGHLLRKAYLEPHCMCATSGGTARVDGGGGAGDCTGVPTAGHLEVAVTLQACGGILWHIPVYVQYK